jgi:carboxymethylenebutenolidase
MRATTVRAQSSGGTLPVYDVEPDQPAESAIVVIQEAYGVNDHIEDVARRLASAGYRAVAPQLFHRDGVNALPYEFEAAKPHLANLTTQGIRADVEATLQHLEAHGFALPTVGIVGFCMGGSVAMLAASDHAFGAAVTFYGGGVSAGRFGIPALADLAPQLKAPWLGLYGDRDQTIPVDDIETLREEAAKAEVPTSLVRYPDAGHAFHCDARPANYHEPSAKDAWTRALDWFARYLQRRA